MVTAALISDNYYIYLIDIERMSKHGYTPTIIKNPANSVIESDNWLLQPTSNLVVPVDNKL
jgi:hypothetical protein